MEIVTEADDPEGDPLTYFYAWTVDGMEAGNDTETVAASDTLRGEVWEVTVIANDGELDGGGLRLLELLHVDHRVQAATFAHGLRAM